uniref:(California timema) hypothetical protein n=1 Tax=Timema californicum TaxID=61474 RepID=A0A7R9P2W1_TIMCA|nr:unnamed protein product [Timema californicum]
MDRWLKSGSLKKTIKTSATVPPVAMEASTANSVEEDGAVANARISGQDEGFLDESATAGVTETSELFKELPNTLLSNSVKPPDTAPKQRGRRRVYEGRVKWNGGKNEVDGENEGGDIDWLSDGSGARDGLDGHLVSCHRYPPDQYKCDQCPRTFSWRPTLARHRVTQHGEQRRYPCENCPKVFSDPSTLQRHIRTYHVGARSHACPECGKTFATSSGLKQHTHIHSSVKPFQCEVCFKAYTQFSNLCRHKRMHADCQMQIKCTKCNQSFNTVTSLSKHKRFCDSTSPTTTCGGVPVPPPNSHHPGLTVNSSSGMPHLPPTPSAANNPFFMYPPRHPGFPMYSPSLLPPYPSLFHHPSAPPPPFLPNPFMFPQKSLEEVPAPPETNSASHDEERHPTPHRPFEFPVDGSSLHRSPLDFFRNGLTRDNPSTPPAISQVMSNKISPPSADEAVSNLRPSPARPLNSESGSTYPDPKEEIPVPFALKRLRLPRDEGGGGRNCSPTDLSLRKDRRRSPVTQQGKAVARGKEEVPKTKESTGKLEREQPLDLRVERKRKCEVSIEPDETRTTSSSCVSPPQRQEVNKERNKDQDSILDNIPEKITAKFTSKGHESGFGKQIEKFSDKPQDNGADNTPEKTPDRHKHETSTSTQNQRHHSSFSYPERLSSSLPLGISSTMAYPRPVHPMPMFLDVYRPPFPNFPTPPSSGNDSLLPPPHPFGPSRGFPLFGPLINGMTNGHMGGRHPFDIRNSGLHGFPGAGKPYEGVLNPHIGNGGSSGGGVGGPGNNGKLKDRYSCKFCGKVFPRSANLTRHLRTHTGEQPYKCKYCERSFSISSNLQRHVRNIHNKEKPFKCHLCERCFGQQTNLDRHLKKHEADDGNGVVAVADSPGSSNENERDDSYFDEIRSFMGKVTPYSGGGLVGEPLSFQAHVYPPPAAMNPIIDVVGKDDEDSNGLSEATSPHILDMGMPQDDRLKLCRQRSPIGLVGSPEVHSPVSYEVKVKAKNSMNDEKSTNNNCSEHEAMEIST